MRDIVAHMKNVYFRKNVPLVLFMNLLYFKRKNGAYRGPLYSLDGEGKAT